MKRPITSYLTLVTLSVIFFCCKQQKEEAIPGYTCRIVRVVIKSNPTDDRPIQNAEIVKVDDETVKVSFYKESTYAYDKQGRLVWENDRLVTGDSILVNYAYQPGLVLKKVILYSQKSGIQVSIDSIVLNNQGLSEDRYYQQKVKYDSNGYLTEQIVQTNFGRYAGQVVNGNLMKEYKQLDGLYVFNYSYDLTRSSQPPIYTYWGFESRNLLMHDSIERADLNRLVVYTTDYSYKFDAEGRVKRKISHSEKGAGWTYDTKIHTVVFDYEYDCSPSNLGK